MYFFFFFLIYDDQGFEMGICTHALVSFLWKNDLNQLTWRMKWKRSWLDDTTGPPASSDTSQRLFFDENRTSLSIIKSWTSPPTRSLYINYCRLCLNCTAATIHPSHTVSCTWTTACVIDGNVSRTTVFTVYLDMFWSGAEKKATNSNSALKDFCFVTCVK